MSTDLPAPGPAPGLAHAAEAPPPKPRLRGQKEGTRCRTVWRNACEWCGVAFRTNQPDAKFCSPAHKTLNRKLVERRMREAYPVLMRMRVRELNPETGKYEYKHKGELARLSSLADAWLAQDRRRLENFAAARAAEKKGAVT
jgi:hypothetical protein